MVQLTPTMVVHGPDGGPAVPVNLYSTDFHAVAQQFLDSQDNLERIREDLLNGLNAAMPDYLEKHVPTADTGKLDGAAEACRKAASAIRGLASSLQGLIGNNSSADVDELEQFWQRTAGPQSILTELPQALDDVANSLDGFRDGFQDRVA